MSAAERRWRGEQVNGVYGHSGYSRQDSQSHVMLPTPVIEPKTKPSEDNDVVQAIADDASTEHAHSEIYDHHDEIIAENNTSLQTVDGAFSQDNMRITGRLEGNDDALVAAVSEASISDDPRAQSEAIDRHDPQQRRSEDVAENAAVNQQQSTSFRESSRRKKRVVEQTPHCMVLRKRRRLTGPQAQLVPYTAKEKCASVPKILRLETVRCEGGTLEFVASVELPLEVIQKTRTLLDKARELVIREFGKESWELRDTSAFL